MEATGLRVRLAAPPDPRRSLVGRLVWLAAVWCVLALIVTGVLLTSIFERSALGRYDRSLSGDADDLYAGLSVGADGAVFAPVITDARATRPYSGKYWQIGRVANGRIHALPEARSRSLWDSEDLQAPSKVLAALSGAGSARYFFDGAGPVGQHLRITAMRRTLTGRPEPVVIMTALDRGPVDADLRRFAGVTAGVLVLLGAVLVAAVIVQVRVGLRPLFAMGRDVATVRQGGQERLTGDYPSELAPLAAELNALLDHNQEVVERQRTHVGNLAHALKTPISVMLSETEARPDDALAEVVRRQAELMRAQVEHHLRRARASARSPGSGERTPVAAVLEELARTLDRIYGRRGVDIDVDAEADIAFLGERQDLLEMAGNLLENACKYGRTEVRARAAALGQGAWRLTVEDDGPGLDEAQQAEALRRGRRLDESAPGSGLGLSIVDELARAYGGALKLGRSELGGLSVELTLPRAA